MKRIALALATLTLAAGLASAQDATPAATPVAKLSVYSWGVFYPAVAIGSEKPVAVWGPDWTNNPGTYNSFKLSYTAASFGFAVDERFALDQLNTTLYSAAAWFKFNDAVKVTFGKINDGEYSEFSQLAGDQLESKFFNQEFGTLVQVYPSAPLSLAGAYYVPGTENAGTTTLPGTTKRNPAENLGFAASYKLSDSGVVHGFYKTYQIAGSSAALKLVDIGGNYAPAKDWYFSAAYERDFSVEGSGATANALNVLYLGAKYTGIEQVTITLDYNVNAGTRSGGSSKTYTYVEGAVEYAVPSSPIAVGLQAGYDSGIANTWKWQGNALEGGSDDFTSLVGGAEIYPYAQYNVTGSASVRVGFLYLTGGIDQPSTTDKTKSAWAVPITYTLSF